MKTQGRKDPTQRRGQRDSHQSPYWTRAATFSLRKVAVKPFSQFSIFSNYAPQFAAICPSTQLQSQSKEYKSIENANLAYCCASLSDEKKYLSVCNVLVKKKHLRFPQKSLQL